MMNDISIVSQQLFPFLEGTWTGEGRGEYPTIPSFDYSETLIFTRRDEKSLAYEQRTQKRYDGQQEWLVSHSENGFIRVLENGVLELVNAQSGGRSEVLVGTVEMSGDLIRIHFRSRTITNDPRILCTERNFELESDRLRYEMEMQTTAADRLMSHLMIELKRIT
jgi:THAP domain-containing protein 4